jgi:hypothetical protein
MLKKVQSTMRYHTAMMRVSRMVGRITKVDRCAGSGSGVGGSGMPCVFAVAVFWVVVLVSFCCDVAVGDTRAKEEVVLKLTIPSPPGIMIDKAFGRYVDAPGQEPNNVREVFRVGRNQFNSIKMRPKWSQIHVFEKILTPLQCKSIIDRAEVHASKHGWSKGRHIDYDVR